MNLIILCRELENPFAVEITDPSKTTVSDLKTMVSDTASITKEELILYFNEDILPDSAPLSDWKELKDGAVVMAVIKPLQVTLKRYCSPIEVVFTIPKLAIEKWSTRTFFDFCLHKGGLPYLKNGRYVFAVRGSIIEDEGKKMSEYECFTNDLTISVTFIQPATKLGFGQLGEFYTAFPSTSFMEMTLGYETTKSTSESKHPTWGQKASVQSKHPTWRQRASVQSKHPTWEKVAQNSFSYPWILKVKLLDGKETAVKVNQHYFTPVFQLRQQISPDSIIRLTFGSTILEDWDEEGNMMLLCSYPDLHDGATLYQINLTEGIRVKYNLVDYYDLGTDMTTKELQAHNTHRLVEKIIPYSPPEYIEIADPKTFTVKKLKSIGKNFAARKNIKTIGVAGTDTKLTTESDSATISSFDYICDGCTIEFKFGSIFDCP